MNTKYLARKELHKKCNLCFNGRIDDCPIDRTPAYLALVTGIKEVLAIVLDDNFGCRDPLVDRDKIIDILAPLV